jgi:predicted nucleotidyltransferase
MKARIVEELERIQSEHNVRVLLAVESGSRAWGFASPDSDYDVRFIYAHPTDWYISIAEPRDVIEEMLPGDLDISGWDLRKTLRLFAKCNLALNEWLGSPITYTEVPGFRRQLDELVPTFFNPIAAMNHYCNMAERALTDNYADGKIGIKKLFYVLRPLYACRWIEHMQTQPPTEFDKLIDAEWIERSEREWVQELVIRKASEKEAQPLGLGAEQAKTIETEITHFKSLMTSLHAPSKSSTAPLDELLRNWAQAASVQEPR